MALSIASRPPAINRHPALWSPDFPPRTCVRGDCLASFEEEFNTMRGRGAAPHAGYFLCAAKESNQRNATPLRQPAASFGCMNASGDFGEHCLSSAAGHVLCGPPGRVAQPPDAFMQPKWRRRGRVSGNANSKTSIQNLILDH